MNRPPSCFPPLAPRFIVKTALVLALLLLASHPVSAAITADPAEAAFQQALALRQAGKTAQAASLLHSMLARDPSLHRVRLELAVCQEQIGDGSGAALLYQQVLASNPPPGVRRTVQARLSALSAGMMLPPPSERGIASARTTAAPPNLPGESAAGRAATVRANDSAFGLHGDLAIGMIYDTNVNVGPISDTVTIFDLPFTVDPGARPTADWGTQVRASLQAQIPMNSRWKFITSVTYDRLDYLEMNAFDFDRVAATVGPALSGANWQVALFAGYGASWLGRDLYSQDLSLSPQWTWQFQPQWTSTFTASAATGMNSQNGGYSGASFFVSESVQWTSKNGRTFIRPRLYYVRDNADAEFLASNQVGGGIGFFAMLPWGISFYVEPSARLAQYEGREPLYGKTRREPQFVLNANLARPLGFWGLEAALGYTYTRNDSNVEQFDYQRSQITFLIRKGW